MLGIDLVFQIAPLIIAAETGITLGAGLFLASASVYRWRLGSHTAAVPIWWPSAQFAYRGTDCARHAPGA